MTLPTGIPEIIVRRHFQISGEEVRNILAIAALDGPGKATDLDNDR